MEMNDLMALKALGENDKMTPFEQYMMGYKQQRSHTSGTAIAGLVLGTVGTAAAIGAWIFGPTYSNAKASGLRDLANARYDATQNTLNQLTSLLAAERNERINGDLNITTTINDTVSGQQSGQLSQSQQLSNDIALGLMTGKYSENPQKVELYSPATPFQCGCGCNG